MGNAANKLLLWGDAPRWEYSTAPLMEANGKPVDRPFAGTGGHALHFNDQQVCPGHSARLLHSMCF